MAVNPVALTFFFLSAIILVGFLTLRLFQVTRFPDVPILLAIGLVLGPLNAAAVHYGFGSMPLRDAINVGALQEIAPIVSALALLLILFDSGLKLDFSQFGRSVRPAMLHTFPLFLLTMFTIAWVAYGLMGMPLLVAVILAVALSNVGQTVSAAIIREIQLDPEVRSMYFIEMALYDLLSIPILVALLEFAQGLAPEAGAFFQSLARVIAISLLLGVAMGLLWMYVLVRLRNYAYSYMITFAFLLLLYALNSFLGGSGPVSVLVFGLLVGNRATVLRLLNVRRSIEAEGDRVHSFHDEITFFIRAFFFVFLGLTFSTGTGSDGWAVFSRLPLLSAIDHTGALFLLAVALIFLAIVAIRYVVVRFLTARAHESRRALFVVYGRGLGTAVLATFAFTQPAFENNEAYRALLAPWQPIFTNTALLIILLTVTGTSLTVWLREWRNRDRSPPSRKRRRGASAKA